MHRASTTLLYVELNRDSHLPFPQQLCRAWVEAIREGKLAPGTALPGTRPLAAELGVHRNTVVAAFEELIEQGWFEASSGSHTRVTPNLPATELRPASGASKGPLGFSLPPFENSASVFEAAPPSVLDFSSGLPDARLFRSELLARAYRRSLQLSSGRALDFGSPLGSLKLRQALSEMLALRRGFRVSSDELLVTRGSQFALHLLAITLLRPGDWVAVESPGYPSQREAFKLAGAQLLPVPVDAEGFNVEVLAQELKRKSIRAVCVTPHCHDPTHVTLSASRRMALLKLAERYRFAIIEMDTDHEFQFEGSAALPLASDDPNRWVVLVGTLSKGLAPGLRMGFIAAAQTLISTLVAVRGQIDRHGDLGLENAVAELLEDGELLRHTLRAKRVFHRRRDLLVQLLRQKLGSTLEFEIPRAGLGLWARVHDLDAEAWVAASYQAGVRFFSGRSYMPNNKAIPFVRMGFAHLDERELTSAVTRIAAARRGGSD